MFVFFVSAEGLISGAHLNSFVHLRFVEKQFHESPFQSTVSSVWIAEFEVGRVVSSSSVVEECCRHNIPR